MAHHNTLFAQLLKLLPRHEFSRLAKKHDGTRRTDAMNRWTQFVGMATAQLGGRTSLRDIESTMATQKHLQYHLGVGAIKRTTLSRANQSLSSGFFEELFSMLQINGVRVIDF